MTANQKIRNTSFVIEGLNSFATVLYFNYLYFFMQARFGFSDKGNLALAALLGFIYIFAAWQGGKFAHRLGYFLTGRANAYVGRKVWSGGSLRR